MSPFDAIANVQARQFLLLYWPHRTMLRDFYEALSEARYDFRLTDTLARKSASPRESLTHILDTRLMYLQAVKTGALEFKPMIGEGLWSAPKVQLLGEWDRIETDMLAYLDSPAFDPAREVACPWGTWSATETLYLIRDHEILHVGWNLALMDALDLPRFKSVQEYWG